MLRAVDTFVRVCHRCRMQPATVSTVVGGYCHACYEPRKQSIAEYEQKIRVDRLAYLRRLSEMGDRFSDRTFANYRVNEANRAAFQAAQTAWETRGGLYLCGDPGNGKTHLAAAIVNAAIDAQVEAVFTTSVGLLQRIREGYRKRDGESERSVLAHYAGVQVLALDDLGTEPFTADTGRLFYALINARYERRGLRLIVTSNLSLADLVAQWRKSGVEPHVGDKIADRIRELCENRFVRISAPSHRGTSAS